MESKLLNKVIVYGGGVIGNLVSLSLKRNGFDVFQIKSDVKKTIDRTYALSPGSVDWMKAMGLRDKFFNSLYPIENIEIIRQDSKTKLSAASVFQPALAYMVSEKNLMKEIQIKLTSEGIKSFPEPKKIILDNSLDKVLIKLGKESITASLLVACDGANSKIKEHLNIRKKIKNFNQNAIVFNFETFKDVEKNAKQYFLEDSILALLPISPRTISVVWSCNQNIFQRLSAINDSELILELKSVIGNDYSEISNVSNKSNFPLTMVLNDKFFDKRVVLMGNAAHSIHPLAGQGLNLGIRDIIDFEKCFISNQYKDIGLSGFLRRFERSRRIDTFEFSTLTSGLQWAFSSKNKLINQVLIKSIKILEAKDSIKKFLIKKAIT
ncbi:FAD-dependent monooxygenase [Methylophilaceae bacterium]|jgi:2-polyprenylphenol 6-hydroxylase|nr:FAD-dependent monooxygenase [Methylophilaceae bacterium]